METVQKRVEDYEASEEEAQAQADEELQAAKSLKAGDWISEVEGAEDAEALASLRALYDRTGNDFSTVRDAFEDKTAEFNNDGS
jgi:nitrogen fixation protein FixH